MGFNHDDIVAALRSFNNDRNAAVREHRFFAVGDEIPSISV